jgi:hypothetical protein
MNMDPNTATQVTAATAAETVKNAVTAASLVNHVKNNRIEYLLAIGLMHLLGVSDRILANMSGVCF